MGTVRQDHELEFSASGPREAFLPPESPQPMTKQQLRELQRGRAHPNAAPRRAAFRRACIFIGTAAMTAGGSYEMYEVLQVGGVTILEWMVVALFVLLFAWIAFSFMSTVAGFVVLLFRVKDPLGIDPEAPLPSIASRNAMLLPTYNEDPHRIMARLKAMHESVDQSGHGSKFDWFVLSDTTNPSIWIAEEKCFLGLAASRRPIISIIVIAARTRRENQATSRTGSSGSAAATTT